MGARVARVNEEKFYSSLINYGILFMYINV
jgi:hypothetical protein